MYHLQSPPVQENRNRFYKIELNQPDLYKKGLQVSFLHYKIINYWNLSETTDAQSDNSIVRK
jgi:hypothetical protein